MRTRTGEWYEVVVAYEKLGEDGLAKKTKDTVVVEAASLGDAEERVLEEFASSSIGETKCIKAGLANYKEIFFADDGDIFYKAKVNFITLCEGSGKEKKTANYYLTNASSIENARRNIVEVFNGTMIDYVIATIGESGIIEVYEQK
jgi:hypothetical protein